MSMQSDVFNLWKQKELELGKSIKASDIANTTGLHLQTVEQILNGHVGRVDMPKVEIVCKALGINKRTPIFYFEPEKEPVYGNRN